MSTRRLHTEMVCSKCGRTSSHEIVYVGRLMLGVRCSACGAELRMHGQHLVQDWLTDLSSRLVGKRRTLLAEARADSWSFARQLPLRLARQPRKLADEAVTVLARVDRKP